MDRAIGTIINTIFYLIVAAVTLAVIGVNPLILFASVSSFFVGFAFMVSSSIHCSQFESLDIALTVRPLHPLLSRLALPALFTLKDYS